MQNFIYLVKNEILELRAEKKKERELDDIAKTRTADDSTKKDFFTSFIFSQSQQNENVSSRDLLDFDEDEDEDEDQDENSEVDIDEDVGLHKEAKRHIRNYLDADAFIDNKKRTVLGWWKEHRFEHPIVARLARIWLAVPATSTASERVFSDCGVCLPARRNRLSPKMLENQIMVRRNTKHVSFQQTEILDLFHTAKLLQKEAKDKQD